jgi:hypothetical protein
MHTLVHGDDLITNSETDIGSYEYLYISLLILKVKSKAIPVTDRGGPCVYFL